MLHAFVITIPIGYSITNTIGTVLLTMRLGDANPMA